MKTRYTLALGTALAVLGPGSGASDLYGIQFSGLTDLYSINQANGAVSSIGPTGKDNLGDLTSDTRPGSPHLWGVRIASNELFEFNPATGAALSSVPLSSRDNMVSIAFDPVGGKLYGNTSVGFGAAADTLYEINPTTGTATAIGPIGFGNVYSLGFDQSGNLYGISDTTDQLIAISAVTGAGSLIAGLSVGLAFDIASRPEDNTMFLADSGTFSIYTVDTGTGALSLVGPYGAGDPNIVGLAFLNGHEVPEGSTLLGGGMLGAVVGGMAWRRFRSRR